MANHTRAGKGNERRRRQRAAARTEAEHGCRRIKRGKGLKSPGARAGARGKNQAAISAFHLSSSWTAGA